jgi:hypothetical protein
VTHTITLVTDVYLSKTEALDALSAVFEVVINTTEPSNSVLDLEGGVVLSIEVPKFGEDLPLTVDLIADDPQILEASAAHVIERTRSKLSWLVTVVGR